MMNKGIIMEVKKDYSIALTDDGFVKVKNKLNMVEGSEILFVEEDICTAKKSSFGIYRYSAVAAVFALVFLFSAVFYNNNLAVYAVVTMDINPSVEIELNRDDEVVGIIGLNEDGHDFDELDIVGMSLEEAIEALIAEATRLEYIDEDGYETATIVFTAVPIRGGSAEEVVNKIEAVVFEDTDDDGTDYDELNIAVTESTKEKLDEAKDTETPLPLIELEVNLDEIDTVKELFENEEVVAALEAGGQVTIRKGNKNKVVIADEAESEEDVDAVSGATSNDGSPGNSVGNRNDLNEVVMKLQWVLGNVEDAEAVAQAQAFLGALAAEDQEGEDFNFTKWKKDGQAAVKSIKDMGIDIDYDDDSDDDDEDSDSDDDEDIDSDDDEAEEEWADLQEVLFKLNNLTDGQRQKLSVDDASKLNGYIAKAEGLSEGDDEVRQEKKNGQEWIKYLREMYGIKASDDGFDDDGFSVSGSDDDGRNRINDDRTSDDDDDDKGRGKGRDSDDEEDDDEEDDEEDDEDDDDDEEDDDEEDDDDDEEDDD